MLFRSKVAIGNLPRGIGTGDFDESKLSPNVKMAVDLYLAMVDVSHNVRRNYISSLRVCIKEDRKFSPNAPREKAKEAKEAKEAPKPDDTKPSDVKTPLDEVIRRNFKTLLDNNRKVACKLIDELAKMACVDLGDEFDFEDEDYDIED